ncbi:tetratricopeptide repeat-containing sulfotransferase family protein [Hyphococcus sp.]|uniref:tetratricopeptide repeat-containing sulfotransferase family protein n=1 Tax=Hyphococcus sp. TaxID=2038636 RepID=UPI0037538DA3
MHLSIAADQIEAILGEAQRLMTAGRFNDAYEKLEPLLDDENELVDALYLSAVCQRYLNQHHKASSLLTRLKSVAPDFGRAFQEEGHLALAAGDQQKALSAFQNAVRANPGLEASWRAQEKILQNLGRETDAAQAKAQAERLSRLPRELLAVTNYIHEGKLLKAENLCRRFLQHNARHVEGMRLLADIGARLGVLEDADFLLESAIEFEPDNIQLRFDYIQLLRKRQKFQAALDQAKSLYERDPDNPLFQSHYAIESLQTGDFEKALALFDAVLERVPNDPATLTSRGHALKTWGRQEEAIKSYRAAFAAKPDQGDAYYALANLKTYVFTDDELASMREQEACEGAVYQDRFHLCFALGKAFEDRGQYEAAFSYYSKGNDLKRLKSAYRADDMDQEFRAQMSICTEELFKTHSGVGHAAPDPIFIVGLPRAGSTLLEQILASHSQVDGTLELPNILSLSQSLRGRQRAGAESDYPKILQTLTPEKFAKMGEAYLDDTRIHRAGAPFFVDKMPNNFRHIGLIHLILPNAKIIDARREPMACCFSGFKQLFAEGQEFTYGLEEIGRYYRGYVELMRHWDEMLPGKVLRVQHEDVLDDLETQVRRLLDFCELPFEDACLDFHKTKRSVRTASSEQVRQPINKTGVDQWRRFEPFLDPLKNALGPALTEYRA